MAARIRLAQTEETRARIQASQLINRLEDHVFGKLELSQSQVNAAKILLGKTIPDLSAVELSGDADNPAFPAKIEIVLKNAT